MRSTQPISSPQTPSMPVSSYSSRTQASAKVSPNSTRPPGRLHSPWPGAVARCTSNKRPADIVTAPTHTCGRSGICFECAIHMDRARDEPESFEEVLAFTIAGQDDRVDRHRIIFASPVEREAQQGFTDTDAARFWFDEHVVQPNDARAVDIQDLAVRET